MSAKKKSTKAEKGKLALYWAASCGGCVTGPGRPPPAYQAIDIERRRYRPNLGAVPSLLHGLPSANNLVPDEYY